MRLSRVLVTLMLGVGAVAATGGPAVANQDGHGGVPVVGDWTAAGQNAHNTRSAATEHRINPGNVADLRTRWSFAGTGDMFATPAVYQGVIYTPDSGGTLWALRADDGSVIWSKKISDYTGTVGDGSRTTPAVSGDLLVLGSGFYFTSPNGPFVIGVNRRTGQLLWRVQADPNPRAKITGAPVIEDGIAYVGVSSSEEALPPPHTFRGSVLAVNVKTGHVLWQTAMAPSGYSGNAVWGSSPAVDRRTGLVYVATGNNYTVPDGVCAEPDQTGCTPPAADDYFDSVVAIDRFTGQVRWSHRTLPADAQDIPNPPAGTDLDFGSMPNFFTARVHGRDRDLVGVGQKSGVYWALDARTGEEVWNTKVGPSGHLGGIQWGSATDGKRIYVAEANSDFVPFQIPGPNGPQTVTGGLWAALDPATGAVLWRTPDPNNTLDMGYVSAANGVVYVGSGAGAGTNNMLALDAATGKIKWGFDSGGSVLGGAAIVDGSVYWGSGYYIGQENNKLYAFDLGDCRHGR